MSGESIFVLHAFRMGVMITFLYDCLRVLRRVISHSSFWVSLEDLLFWCFCASEVFVMMYRVSDGILRWYAVVGALAGMFLYLHTFSKPFVRLVSSGLRKAAALVGRLLHRVCTPIRGAVSGIAAVSKRTQAQTSETVKKGSKRLMRFFKNRLTVLVKMFKIMMRI